MISIKGFKDEYILDLNESTSEDYSLQVDSSSPIKISYISDIYLIDAKIVGGKTLKINVDLKKLKDGGTIRLVNLRREKLVVKLKPNTEEIREKNYTFKLGKHKIEGKSITFNIVSKENGKNEPWSITYNGKPIGYLIKKIKTKVTFTLSTILAQEAISNIVLQQDNSGKEIRLKLRHKNNNSVELYEKNEAD